MSTNTKRIGLGTLAVAILLAVVIVIAALATSSNGHQKTDASSPSTPSPTASATSSADCPAQFVQKDITDTKLRRFVEGGIDAETAAKSNAKLLAAAGHDASTLRFYARTFGLKDLPSEATMVNGNCLSEAGQEVYDDLETVTSASGTKFTDAPARAYNSGVDNAGNPVVDKQAGISGNRKAIKYTLADGSNVYILVRCGNPVFKSPPKGTPPGKTDNPPRKKPPKKCPPDMPHGKPPYCKDSPSEDPYQKDKAPIGGGKNKDKGPGDKTKNPTKPGDKPRTNPPKPKPEPPSNGGNKPKPKPDPTTPPKPEPSAPPPDKPETGCIPIPGVEDCS